MKVNLVGAFLYPLRGRGDQIPPCEEYLLSGLGDRKRRLVWELGQTCEAAGDGTIKIFFLKTDITV